MEKGQSTHPAGISIHALREESDACGAGAGYTTGEFQSTPSARRATGQKEGCYQSGNISIHALREESDADHVQESFDCHNFNPRPPRGERRRGESR